MGYVDWGCRMTSKHTPGPWIVKPGMFGYLRICDLTDMCVAITDRALTKAQIETNAALIARAPELLEENKRLKNRIDELEAERAWQPIETAPKDLTEVLLYHPVGGVVSGFFDSRWRRSGKITDEMPTHWMPKPKMEDE